MGTFTDRSECCRDDPSLLDFCDCRSVFIDVEETSTPRSYVSGDMVDSTCGQLFVEIGLPRDKKRIKRLAFSCDGTARLRVKVGPRWKNCFRRQFSVFLGVNPLPHALSLMVEWCSFLTLWRRLEKDGGSIPRLHLSYYLPFLPKKVV